VNAAIDGAAGDDGGAAPDGVEDPGRVRARPSLRTGQFQDAALLLVIGTSPTRCGVLIPAAQIPSAWLH
jgi:hypothetical protein